MTIIEVFEPSKTTVWRHQEGIHILGASEVDTTDNLMMSMLIYKRDRYF